MRGGLIRDPFAGIIATDQIRIRIEGASSIWGVMSDQFCVIARCEGGLIRDGFAGIIATDQIRIQIEGASSIWGLMSDQFCVIVDACTFQVFDSRIGAGTF